MGCFVRDSHLSDLANALPSMPASPTSCFTLSMAGTCSVGPELKYADQIQPWQNHFSKLVSDLRCNDTRFGLGLIM